MGLVIIYFLFFVHILRCFVSFYSPKALSWPTQEKDGKHMNSRMRQRERERELHLVLNLWLSGLGWAWRSIGCGWYNFSPFKSSCGDCCHVPTLEWNNVPRGPALHPNAFVTLWACMRHPSLDTWTVPCGLLSHIGMLGSLCQTEPQIEETEKWEETRTEWLRQRQTEGLRQGAGFIGEVFLPLA